MRIVLILLLFSSISAQNICNLNIAQDKMAAFSGRDNIFNKGDIDQQWKKESLMPYKSPLTTDLEYFYAVEVHETNLPSHQTIV